MQECKRAGRQSGHTMTPEAACLLLHLCPGSGVLEGAALALKGLELIY